MNHTAEDINMFSAEWISGKVFANQGKASQAINPWLVSSAPVHSGMPCKLIGMFKHLLWPNSTQGQQQQIVGPITAAHTWQTQSRGCPGARNEERLLLHQLPTHCATPPCPHGAVQEQGRADGVKTTCPDCFLKKRAASLLPSSHSPVWRSGHFPPTPLITVGPPLVAQMLNHSHTQTSHS